jgi:hypothetical protein
MLRHEVVHVRQFRQWPMKFLDTKYTWFLNAFLMGFCYLLVAPVFLTFRSMFEREGYTQTLLAAYEGGALRTPESVERHVDYMLSTFTGVAGYFYMDTATSTEKWARQTIEDIVNGKITNSKDTVL